MPNIAPSDYDVIIAGGGLVGASLALALNQPQAQTGCKLKIAVVEAVPVDSKTQASYDERTLALTYSSKLILEALDVWQGEVQQEACALERIHLSNRGHFGICHLDCETMQTPALGYVCPTRTLGYALYQRLSQCADIDLIYPASVTEIEQHPSHVKVSISSADDADSAETQSLSAKLIVIADGGRSKLLPQLGFKPSTRQYPSKAVLSIVSVDRGHKNTAYERFTPAGPLALLPLTGQRFAVVWTEHNAAAAALLELDDEAYIAALQDAFGYRAGLFSLPSARKAYPLTQNLLDRPMQQRTLVMGNAAHTVHPVGGQGFNLGLRDAVAFAQHWFELGESDEDIGSDALLSQYCDARATETRRVGQFTDGLLQAFGHPSAPVKLGRNAALLLIENMPWSKRLLLRRTMGLAKHQPKLARGKRLL